MTAIGVAKSEYQTVGRLVACEICRMNLGIRRAQLNAPNVLLARVECRERVPLPLAGRSEKRREEVRAGCAQLPRWNIGSGESAVSVKLNHNSWSGTADLRW